MLWAVYQVAFAAGFALLSPYFFWRMARRGGYWARFEERFGRHRADVRARLASGPRPVWIHAVSVGEMQVAAAIAEEWRRRAPEVRFVFSMTTPTGRRIAECRAGSADVVIYYPIDFPGFVRRALDAVRPRALVLCEGELWPNMIRACARRGVPVAVVNGRVSDRSWPRYRHVRFLTRRLLPCLRRWLGQSPEDAQRIRDLGAPPEVVEVVGSAKYDVAPPDSAATATLRDELRRRGFSAGTIWLVGGSTWPGEEAALWRVTRRLRDRHPALRLLVVPRHAERGRVVADELRRLGASLYRRSSDQTDTPTPDVALFDTTGELAAVYGLADIVFVGKSLTCAGGQNPIEPARWGRPILCGPRMENFRAIVEDFRAAEAIRVVTDERELADAVAAWLDDPAARTAAGQRALEVVLRNAGAISRTVDRLTALGSSDAP